MRGEKRLNACSAGESTDVDVDVVMAFGVCQKNTRRGRCIKEGFISRRERYAVQC